MIVPNAEINVNTNIMYPRANNPAPAYIVGYAHTCSDGESAALAPNHRIGPPIVRSNKELNAKTNVGELGLKSVFIGDSLAKSSMIVTLHVVGCDLSQLSNNSYFGENNSTKA